MKRQTKEKDHAPLVVLPTSTDAKTVSAVRAAGYVPVLCDDPSRVKVVLPVSDVTGSDLLMSALHGICKTVDGTGRGLMVHELFRRMADREQAKVKKGD